MEFESVLKLLPAHCRSGTLIIGAEDLYETLCLAYGWDAVFYDPTKVYEPKVTATFKTSLSRIAFGILEYNGEPDVAADIGMLLILMHELNIPCCVIDSTGGKVSWPNVFRFAGLVLQSRGDVTFLLDTIEHKRHIGDKQSRIKIAFDIVKTARQGVYYEQVRRIGPSD